MTLGSFILITDPWLHSLHIPVWVFLHKPLCTWFLGPFHLVDLLSSESFQCGLQSRRLWSRYICLKPLCPMSNLYLFLISFWQELVLWPQLDVRGVRKRNPQLSRHLEATASAGDGISWLYLPHSSFCAFLNYVVCLSLPQAWKTLAP